MNDAVLEGVIIKGVGGAYYVSTPHGLYTCNARGIFRNRQESPVVGDRVRVLPTEAFNTAERTGTLQELLPRKNELYRPRIANVDQIIITMAAAQPDFNPGLLDRYLLLIEQADIPAVLCVNKQELAASGSAAETYAEIYKNAGYPVFLTSAETGEGIASLQEAMTDKVSVFAGPSGVGKSSLINRLIPEAVRETGKISTKIERGRHTTRHTEFMPIRPSGYCADTPGFTSLELDAVKPAQAASLFIEFRPFLGNCRFRDCLHVSEADCAVKAQVEHAIHPLRYESYVNILGKLT